MDNTTSSCAAALFTDYVLVYIGRFFSSLVMCISLLAMVVIRRTPALQNISHIYIFSNAACNIILSVIFTIISCMHVSKVIHDVNMAISLDSVLFGVSYAFSFSACLHVTLIAIDRYIYILKPFFYRKHVTSNRVFYLLLCVWTVTLIYINIPIIFYRSEIFHRQCIFMHPPIVYGAFSVCSTVVFYSLICGCYFRIARVAFTRKKTKDSIRQSEAPNIAITNGKAALKSITFFLSLFGTYFLCYTPLVIISVLAMLSLSITEAAGDSTRN